MSPADPHVPPPHTRFVLIEASHAGNVGAVARAMRVMGFEDLVLVAPRWPDVLTRDETRQRASGATDVLDRARIVGMLPEALHGIETVCATVMTARDFGPPTLAPRPALAELATQTGSLAFVFGPERFGMANEDVYRCHVALSIPTAPDFGSLNLAAAVQVLAYEWRQALGGFAAVPDPLAAQGPRRAPRADAAEVEGLLTHLEQALVAVGFLDPAAPRKLMPRLRQFFHRAQPAVDEVHIWRGVARAMTDAAARAKR